MHEKRNLRYHQWYLDGVVELIAYFALVVLIAGEVGVTILLVIGGYGVL